MIILFGFFSLGFAILNIFDSKNIPIIFTLSNLIFCFSLIKFDCALFFNITSSNFGLSSFFLDRTFEMLSLALNLRYLRPQPLLLHCGLVCKALA